jgi:Pyridoxamine 5'-phosphate oxidase
MAGWREIEAEAPELAARALAIFDAHVHKTLATLRRDGSPRISGIELEFTDGDVWIGSMREAVKALDLRRDPRFAVHSGSEDPPDFQADAKIAGRAEEVSEPGGGSHRFRLDVTELVVIGLGGEPPDHLVVESWHPGRGVERRERR